MEWLFGIIIGAILGAAVAAVILLIRRAAAQAELANLRARAELLDQQVRQHLAEANRMRGELDRAEKAREAGERQAALLSQELQTKQQQFEEQKRLLEEAEKRLTATFKAVGGEALQANNEQFIALAKKTFEVLMTEAKGDVEKKQQAIDALVKPIREHLEKQKAALEEFEKKYVADTSGLRQHLQLIAAAHEKLSSETSRLVKALRRPEQRGRWGEMQLRNAVEMAGMTEHCDFDEQVTIYNGDTQQRPDMVVNLPGRGVIPVDAKVAIDAYLDAIECEDGDTRADCLRRHAEHVERHVRGLANKRYWDGFDKAHAPQLVVMFMPLESALIAALEHKPELQTQAMQQHVLIATPTLLVALLRAVAYGWQQDALAENAREIAKAGAELYARVQKFAGDLEKVGRNLQQATNAYNSAIGSLEARVMPGARKLRDLHATSDGEIQTPAMVETEVRPIVSSELTSLPGLDGHAS